MPAALSSSSFKSLKNAVITRSTATWRTNVFEVPRKSSTLVQIRQETPSQITHVVSGWYFLPRQTEYVHYFSLCVGIQRNVVVVAVMGIDQRLYERPGSSGRR